MNKIIIVSLTGILAVLSTNAMAGRWDDDGDTYYARARVLKVVPVTTTVRVAVPQRECYQEEVHTPVYTQGREGATLVGGLVGGIIGHRLGHGRGGATLAGAIIGSAVGQTMARNAGSYYDEVSYADRCVVHTRYQTQERLLGYDVTYRYRGTINTTRMNYDPGRFIQVRVDVSPVVR